MGTVRIDVTGSAVGQINGLAVIDMGDYSFGRPSRLTARVSLGRGEFGNVEQASQMSGRIHSKGFQILIGYLMGKYGVESTLPVRVSIAFEQTYEDVDGDSASSTELYALLSGLSGLPINQGLAVTGSLDQQGRVQAIGGATRKIEGFFEVCKARGLTGSQGVLVPASNVHNLVLKREVVDAVDAGRFSVYAVESVEQGHRAADRRSRRRTRRERRLPRRHGERAGHGGPRPDDGTLAEPGAQLSRPARPRRFHRDRG